MLIIVYLLQFHKSTNRLSDDQEMLTKVNLKNISNEDKSKLTLMVKETLLEMTREALIRQISLVIESIPAMESMFKLGEAGVKLNRIAEKALISMKSVDLKDFQASEKMQAIYEQLEKARDELLEGSL